MFYYLNGTVALLDANLAVIDCGGVGYACHTSNYTLARLQNGKPAKLFTYCNIKEDAFDIYGFSTREELDCFRRLIFLREKDFQCFELFVIKRNLNGYLFHYACPPIVGASVFAIGSLNHFDHCSSLQYPASAKEKSRRRSAGHPDTSICVPYAPS